jgi:hypothetical protein
MKIFFKFRYVIICLSIIIILISFNNFIKYKLSRLILSHELSILPNLIVKKISRKANFDIYQDKVQAALIFNNYVATHVIPQEINLDDGASWKLLHGSIWCDGVSDILNRLLEVIEVRSYLVWLHDDNMNTPHAISMVDFQDQPLVNGRNSSLDQNTLFMFDPQNNYLPLNKNNKVVNIKYMISNVEEFKEMEKLNSDNIPLNLLINEAQLWDRNIFGKDNSIIRNFMKYVVKLSPDFIFEGLIKFSILINPKIESATKDFYLARLDHILLDHKSAEKKYQFLKDNENYKKETTFWLNNFQKK